MYKKPCIPVKQNEILVLNQIAFIVNFRRVRFLLISENCCIVNRSRWFIIFSLKKVCITTGPIHVKHIEKLTRVGNKIPNYLSFNFRPKNIMCFALTYLISLSASLSSIRHCLLYNLVFDRKSLI